MPLDKILTRDLYCVKSDSYYMTLYSKEKAAAVSGTWVRASQYDLLNGVVVPADGAEFVDFDPWQEFRANVGEYRTVEQPYVKLLELNRNLKDAESKGIRPSYIAFHPRYIAGPLRGSKTKADELILAWCNQHGLLGLVPVLSNSIHPPITIGPDLHNSAWLVTKRHHFRDGGRWTPSRSDTRHIDTTPKKAENAARKFADKGPKPGVTWFNWMNHVFEQKPLDYIEPFFRPVWKDEPLNLPCPNTRKFWRCYGEPLQEFTLWCEMFALCVDHMSQWDVDKAKKEDAVHTVRQSFWALEGLAAGAAASFGFNHKTNTLDEKRVSAGLFASYALMFLWDWQAGRRALSCQACKRYFVSNETRARYCSPRCRNTAQKRRSRARQEESTD